MKAAELQAAMDAALAEYREKVGDLPGIRHQHVYETEDGKGVLIAMNDAERYAAELKVFGQDVADYNEEKIRLARKAKA